MQTWNMYACASQGLNAQVFHTKNTHLIKKAPLLLCPCGEQMERLQCRCLHTWLPLINCHLVVQKLYKQTQTASADSLWITHTVLSTCCAEDHACINEGIDAERRGRGVCVAKDDRRIVHSRMSMGRRIVNFRSIDRQIDKDAWVKNKKKLECARTHTTHDNRNRIQHHSKDTGLATEAVDDVHEPVGMHYVLDSVQ